MFLFIHRLEVTERRVRVDRLVAHHELRRHKQVVQHLAGRVPRVIAILRVVGLDHLGRSHKHFEVSITSVGIVKIVAEVVQNSGDVK